MMSHRQIAIIVALVIAIAVVLPFMVGSAEQAIMTKMLIAAVFATGFNWLLGQAGLLSFGHAAYYGIGAVATLHVMVAVEQGKIYLPTPLLPLAGAGAGLVLAFVAGCFATRRSGTYFALVTLAIAELIHVVAPMWQSVFGGEAGLTATRMPSFGISFESATQVYQLTLAWSIIGIGFTWFLSSTAFGQFALALKGNEQRLRFLGFNTYAIKIVTFAISGMIAGLAGGLLAICNETANYTLFSIASTTQVIFHTFIGGSAYFFAPAIAAAILTAIPYKLSDYTHAWPLYQGILFMVVMLMAPRGLGGLCQDLTTVTWMRESIIAKFKQVILLVIGSATIIILVEGSTRLREHDAKPSMWLILTLLLFIALSLFMVWKKRGTRSFTKFGKLSMHGQFGSEANTENHK